MEEENECRTHWGLRGNQLYEHCINNDAAWRSQMLCDFLNDVGETLLEFKGEDCVNYPLQINEPIVEPFDNDESLHPQVFVKFSAIIAGRKELN